MAVLCMLDREVKATTYRKVVKEGSSGTTSAETKKLVLKIRVEKVHARL